MLLEPLNLALPPLIPLNANKNAEKNGKILMRTTKLMDNKDTDFTTMKKLSKLNYSPTDLLKLLSPSMLISLLTNLEYITTFPDKLWEDTPSNLWDGELKTELPTGLLPILGTWIGDSEDFSKSDEEMTNAVLPMKLFLDYPNFEFNYI
jgi:hypothetical protein